MIVRKEQSCLYVISHDPPPALEPIEDDLPVCPLLNQEAVGANASGWIARNRDLLVANIHREPSSCGKAGARGVDPSVQVLVAVIRDVQGQCRPIRRGKPS